MKRQQNLNEVNQRILVGTIVKLMLVGAIASVGCSIVGFAAWQSAREIAQNSSVNKIR